MNNVQVDANVVINKLSESIAELFKENAILKAQIELFQNQRPIQEATGEIEQNS